MPKKITTTEFIAKAKMVHGDKYDYSKVEYVNNHTKVCIICPIHGEFWQLPLNHLKSKGCSKCNGGVQLNIDDFIAKAKAIHGNKYDYSKVEYKNADTKVCIVCPIHGEFWQTPNNHLKGKGCPKCNGGVQLSIDEFIAKAKAIHGDKYDYSKVEYKNSFAKVCIICPIHGEFFQTPQVHLRGGGCPKCWKERKSLIKFSNTEEFIRKAKAIHGNKYDYSKVEYKRSNEKVCIICPTHGEFWQTPNKHLQGQGCPKCGKIAHAKKHMILFDEFVKRAREIHGDKYDYSKVDLGHRDKKNRICIICPTHGEFWQTVHNHLNGKGCGLCIKPMHDTQSFIELAKKVHGDKYDYSIAEYKNISTKICIICPIHGEFWQLPGNHIHSGYGCPKCNASHLENEIGKFLETNNLKFITEKSFDWLGKQELDFFLTEYNVAIECQGRQHFEAIDLFGGEEQLNLQIELDTKKRLLCEEHGIKVLYYSNLGIDYPYEVFEDKEELLKVIKEFGYKGKS